jgi:hypothetical protein
MTSVCARRCTAPSISTACSGAPCAACRATPARSWRPAIPGYTAEQEPRLPFDLEGARKLLDGGRLSQRLLVQLNCQSDGLVNEEEFCQAVASMWSRAGLKPKSQPRAALEPADAEAREGRVRRHLLRLGQRADDRRLFDPRAGACAPRAARAACSTGATGAGPTSTR